jgi:hypothetical protein
MRTARYKSQNDPNVYTQLLQFDRDDNYTCKVAQNIQQATELTENGFEYVTRIDGLKLFKKRK